MAYCPPLRVIAATPIGFLGDPPGITSGSCGLSCLTSAGGDQAGCTYLPSMEVWPAHGDRIADRATVAEHIIEPSLAGPDHDGAGSAIVAERDHFAGMRGRRPDEQDRSDRRAARKRTQPFPDHGSPLTPYAFDAAPPPARMQKVAMIRASPNGFSRNLQTA